jgi:hypothetical protein
MFCQGIRQYSRFGAAVLLVAALFLGGRSAQACQTGATINVFNVESLYVAVNDPGNAGAALVLSPGAYVLSAKTPAGVARPNGGRLELEPDMSLYGVTGDRAAVAIDTSLLPISSLRVSFGNTAALRIGRGCNAVEWITIVGNTNSTAGIETDLAGTDSANVRIAHVLAHDSIRGVDVRNIGAGMSGRHIEAEVSDNEFFRGAEGIRVVNINGVIGGQIDVTMNGNYSHGNANGCSLENSRSSSGDIYVRSNGDRFENNGIGCAIFGGLVAAPSGTASSNSVTFDAHGSKFNNNTLTEFVNTGGVAIVDFGGLLATAAETPGLANSGSHNAVMVRLWGCEVFGNQNIDFQAFGARSTAVPTGVAGLDNTVSLELYGSSKLLDVVAIGSAPDDPSGTNSVNVVRGRTATVGRDPQILR